MTDDQWRQRRDEEEDFGPPLFSDDAAGSDDPLDTQEVHDVVDDVSEGSLSFGDGDTGPLPHWTQPPTGEIPRVLTGDSTDDLDVWSSFSAGGATGSSPAWRDDRGGGTDQSGGLDDITGLSPVFEPEEPLFDDAETTARDESAPVRREPGRITIGTDPTDGASSRPQGANRRPRPSDSTGRGARPSGKAATGRPTGKKPAGGTGGRDMPTAVAVGLAIAVVFIAALKYKPWAVAVIVVLVMGLAAVEYFDRVREKGYQPAITLTDLQLFNRAAPVGPGSLLHAQIWATPAITLRYDQNIISLEFAALLKLRRAEPSLRGAFRVPLPIAGLAILAALPILLIIAAVALEIQSEEIGLPGVMAAVLLALAGPIWYRAVPARWKEHAVGGASADEIGLLITDDRV
jgi:hypothetical protein